MEFDWIYQSFTYIAHCVKSHAQLSGNFDLPLGTHVTDRWGSFTGQDNFFGTRPRKWFLLTDLFYFHMYLLFSSLSFPPGLFPLFIFVIVFCLFPYLIYFYNFLFSKYLFFFLSHLEHRLHQQTLSDTGADPGIFVRGGPTFGKFWQEKKRGGGEKTGGGVSFPFAGVWFKSTFQTIIYIQIIFGRAWSFVQLQVPLSTHTDDMVVFIL